MTQIDRVKALAEPVAMDLALELVDVEFVTEAGRRILRITIDRPEGISHDQCEAMSRKLDMALDESDVMGDQQYHLEVSSPGAERPLKRPEDFARFAGRKVFLKGKAPIEGRRQWKGLLVGLEGEVVKVRTEVGDLAVALDQLTAIRLSLD